jgi:hypothetical protein
VRRVRRAGRAFARAPGKAQLLIGAAVLVGAWFTVNVTYQVIRKPTELFLPLAGTLSKAPRDTWREYGALFREHATATMTPELLAALAQVEGAGNPVAHTYWRWQWSWNPLKWYRPASSAVGMYQITDGTFLEARRYCIHDHVVTEATRWYDVHGCWLNWAYTRVLPSHAIEMTSALLDREVADVLGRRHVPATTRQVQDLAAAIHLCGEGGGETFVHRGFVASGIHCGDHSLAAYLAEVNAMKREFAMFGR